MSMMSTVSQGVGATSSNFTSIGSANMRTKQVKKQYETQEKLALYNKAIAENKAIEARQQAKLIEVNTRTTKDQLHRKHAKHFDSQFVKMSISGISAETGTPLLVQQDQLAEMKLKENGVTYGGYLQSREKEIQATQFDAQADMAQYQADVAHNTGKYKAEMIQFQKKLTMAKMFYDPGNATSFGEVDNPSQFQHLNQGTVAQDLSKQGVSQPQSEARVGKSFEVTSQAQEIPTGSIGTSGTSGVFAMN